MPTPRPLASVRLSTSPTWIRTSRLRDPSLQASASLAPAEVAASTARRAGSSRFLMKRVAPFGAPSRQRSYRRPSDGHALDPDVALPRPDRRRLPRLATEPRLHLEVGADRVDAGQRLKAVADQRCAAAWFRHLATLDQVALGDAEDEVTGGRLDLAPAEGDGVEALLDLADHPVRVGIARLDVG